DATVTGVQTCALPISIAENDGVVYSSGGGEPIGGLVDGQTYYAHLAGGGAIELMDKKSTDGGTVIPLTSNGTGRGHSIVLSGMRSEERRVGKECRTRR